MTTQSVLKAMDKPRLWYPKKVPVNDAKPLFHTQAHLQSGNLKKRGKNYNKNFNYEKAAV